MSGPPVVIAANGLGMPVKQVESGAPVLTIAANGLGAPIVLSDHGAPFVVEGGTPTPTPSDPFAREHFTVSGASAPFYASSVGQAALYDETSNTTFIAWLKWNKLTQNMEAWVVAYDHTAEEWSDEYMAGNQYQTGDTDNHGTPCIEMTGEGRLVIFYGSHDTQLAWTMSANPRDITSWNQQALLPNMAYPHATYVPASNTIYLTGRGDASTEKYSLACVKIALGTDDAPTPGSTFYIFQGTGSLDKTRHYQGGQQLRGTDIHMTWTWNNDPANRRYDVFYGVLDTTTDTVRPYDGALRSIPVGYVDEVASFRVVDFGAVDYGGIPTLAFDGASTVPHVMYTRDAVDGRALWHLTHNGSAWVSTNMGVDSEPLLAAMPVFMAGGVLRAYYVRDEQDIGWPSGGDLFMMERSAGGTWGAETLVRNADPDWYALHQPVIVRDGRPELHAIFNERSSSAAEFFASCRLWAYGTDGYVTWDKQRGDVLAAAFAARCSGTISAPKLAALETMIQAMIEAGTWDQYAALYLLQGATEIETDAYLNLKSTSFTALKTNGTWTAGLGWQGNGSNSLLNTQFTPSTSDTNRYAAGCARLLVRSETADAMGGTDIGTATNRMYVRSAAGNLGYNMNRGSGAELTVAGSADGSGLFDANCGSNNLDRVYRNGTLVNESTGTFARTLLASQIYIGNRSVTAGPTARLYSVAGIGLGATPPQILADHAAIEALRAAWS